RHTRSKRDWSSDVCSSDLSPAREKAPRSTALSDYSLDEIKHNTYRMLCAQRFYAATTYLKSLCPSSDAVRTLHTQLCYALNDPRSEERRVGKECRAWRAQS